MVDSMTNSGHLYSRMMLFLATSLGSQLSTIRMRITAGHNGRQVDQPILTLISCQAR